MVLGVSGSYRFVTTWGWFDDLSRIGICVNEGSSVRSLQTLSGSELVWECVCVCVWQELVQYYQENSLRECFKDVDSRLQTPYKQPEQSAAPVHSNSRSAGTTPHSCCDTHTHTDPQLTAPSVCVHRGERALLRHRQSALRFLCAWPNRTLAAGGRHRQNHLQESSQRLVERRGVRQGTTHTFHTAKRPKNNIYSPSCRTIFRNTNAHLLHKLSTSLYLKILHFISWLGHSCKKIFDHTETF